MIDVSGLGLEIGPSHHPLGLKKAGFNMGIMGHATREQLVAKYHGYCVAIANIEDVDAGSQSTKLVGNICFDYVIASHVIEHLPDLMSFRQQLSRVLAPNGVISLVIPDKRY